MTEAGSLPPDLSGRKCPRHKCWIQSHRDNTLEGRPYIRYCPRCDLERQQHEAALQKESGIEKPKLRIGKI